MTEPTLSAAALRGAVDLSSLGRTPAAPPASAAGPGQGAAGAAASGGILVEASDTTFEGLLTQTTSVPALAVIWSSAHPETREAIDAAVAAARVVAGRLRVIAVDVQVARMVASALQIQQVPLTLGLLAARPVPLFGGVQPAEALTEVIEQFLALAAQNGVTGTFDPGAADEGAPAGAPAGPAYPPLHEEAYQAIERGDLEGAIVAFEQALRENPGDTDAALGLAQVNLLKRTTGVDHIAARKAAATDPRDIDAACTVADLDVLGGHMEDAFGRLIDLIRVTADDDRQRVRRHLVELFDIVGGGDPRVVKARRDLMSALF